MQKLSNFFYLRSFRYSDFCIFGVCESLALFSVNEIKHLEAFSSCHNLRELYLRRNKISSIDELCHLSALKNLK